MPAALERKLKREAKKEGLKGKHKDAYVYGTLRKTGWKPSTQKMNAIDRVVRLQMISKSIDTVSLDYGDEDDQDKRQASQISPVKAGVLGAGTAAGLYATGAMSKPGFVAKGMPGKPGGLGLTGKQTLERAGHDVKNIGKGGLTDAARTIATGANVAASTAKAAGKSLLAKIIARAKPVVSSVMKAYSSRHAKLINLNSLMTEVTQLESGRGPGGVDPGADQFGGRDPGILGRISKDTEEVSARQKLKLKIARLKAMGLFDDPGILIEFEDKHRVRTAGNLIGAGIIGHEVGWHRAGRTGTMKRRLAIHKAEDEAINKALARSQRQGLGSFRTAARTIKSAWKAGRHA